MKPRDISKHWASPPPRCQLPEGWLSSTAGQYPSRLYRRQHQCTTIVRALIMQPDLLLRDEPFSTLDAPPRKDLGKNRMTQTLSDRPSPAAAWVLAAALILNP